MAQDVTRPGVVNWDEMESKVGADLAACEKRLDTLSDYDKKEFYRFREMVRSGKRLSLRNIASLHRIAEGLGAL
jgi:hypothetical protein